MAKRKAVSGGKGRKKKKVDDEEEEWLAAIKTREDIGLEVINKMYHINDECQKSMLHT
jgi:hypothetical protein